MNHFLQIGEIHLRSSSNSDSIGEFGIENVQILVKSVEIVKNLLTLRANIHNFGEIVVENFLILVRLVENTQNFVKFDLKLFKFG